MVKKVKLRRKILSLHTPSNADYGLSLDRAIAFHLVLGARRV